MPATIPLLQEGRYTIEQEFPYVENCSLFQGYDTKTETPVAIIEVPVRLSRVATAAQREEMCAAFAEQAKRLAGFKHRSVIAVRGHFTEAGRNYLVSDPVDGVDLTSVLADQKQPFTAAQISGWADTVLDALNVLHNTRPPLIYRNIRPENILLRSNGNVDLAGFGMVCCGDQAPTNAGGSPLAYSPLEQIWPGLDAASQKVIISKYDEASERILKQDLDAKSDLYSLGATLYKLTTGNTPVDALERSIEMIEGNPDPLQAPNHLVPTVPVEVSDVIMKAMEIRREYRFDSAAIMRQVLKTALVRVREREAEEALTKKVEHYDVSPALRSAPAVSDQSVKNNASDVRPSKTETKPSDPAAAAELSRPDPPQPPRVTETFDLGELEDDVLGILSTSAHTSEAPRSVPVPPVAQVQQESELVDPPAIEPIAESAPAEVPDLNTAGSPAGRDIPKTVSDNVDVRAFDDTSETAATEQADPPAPVMVDEPVVQAKAAAPHASADVHVFADPKRSSLGMPAIAAAAAVLCLAVIGGWFFFGSEPAPAATADSPAVSQPAPQDEPVQSAYEPTTEPAAETTAVAPGTQPETGETGPGSINGEDEPQKVASAASPRTRKPSQAPVKTPTPKKAVTVDDLINDN